MLGEEEDDEGNEHRHDRGNEGIVNACVENVEILGAEGGQLIAIATYFGYELGQVLHVVVGDVARNVGVAELGQVSIIDQSMHLQPPAAQQGGDEWSHQGTDVDEDVENLEAGIALSLCPFQTFGALFGCFGFKVVVHLSDDGLQVTLEQAVATGYQGQGKDGEGQQP